MAEYYLDSRYPGFDFEDPDWAKFRTQFEAALALAAPIRPRIGK